MGNVRAKFTYCGYDATLQATYPENGPDGRPDYKKPKMVELRSLRFNPVYGHNDPNHENTKFWQASPSGEIKLGTVNPAAWSAFELGKEYYVDFTLAATNASA